jgi:hypothetical protein
MFHELTQRYFSQTPHRFLYLPGDDGITYLEIRVNHANEMLLSLTQFDMDLDATIYFQPNTLTWSVEERRSPMSEWAFVMRDKSLRCNYTQINLSDEPYTEVSVADLQSITHVWAGQVMTAKWSWSTNVMASLHPLLASRLFDGCKQLCLSRRTFRRSAVE